MAKITKIKDVFSQSCSLLRQLQVSMYKSGSPLVFWRGIQFIVPENGVMNNLVAVLTGLPAGNRNNNGTFNNIGNNGNFWSSTENNTNNAWNRNLNYNNSNANRNNNNKQNGFSVRCVRYLF